MYNLLVKNISKYNSSTSNFHSVSALLRLLSKTRYCFRNHLVRWGGFQSNQVIKLMKLKVQTWLTKQDLQKSEYLPKLSLFP